MSLFLCVFQCAIKTLLIIWRNTTSSLGWEVISVILTIMSTPWGLPQYSKNPQKVQWIEGGGGGGVALFASKAKINIFSNGVGRGPERDYGAKENVQKMSILAFEVIVPCNHSYTNTFVFALFFHFQYIGLAQCTATVPSTLFLF